MEPFESTIAPVESSKMRSSGAFLVAFTENETRNRPGLQKIPTWLTVPPEPSRQRYVGIPSVLKDSVLHEAARETEMHIEILTAKRSAPRAARPGVMLKYHSQTRVIHFCNYF